MAQNSDFVSTPFSSPITKWALPLVARKDGEFFPSGTAILIAERLALTAQHVILDFMEQLGTTEVSPNNFKHHFYLQAAQLIDGGESTVLWNVSKIWRSAHTDVAFLYLEPTVEESLSFNWKKVELDLRPLEVGAEIVAFGYPNPDFSIEKSSGRTIATWNMDPSTTSGQVTQVFHKQRDSVMLSFPCYASDAQTKPSMSGGPVFSSEGRLVGLICSGMKLGAEDGQSLSYFSMLWPAMATPIAIDRTGHQKGITYPILELARDDFISAKGWHQIEIVQNEQTGQPSVILKT